MSWIFLAAFGQFINAIVAILDKYIVTDRKVLPRPFVYAFYSCIATGFWGFVFLLSFIPGLAQLGVPSFSNVAMPSLTVIALSFLSSYTFFMALVAMYTALKDADASDVMPAVGAISAISSLGLAYVFLNASLTPNFIWGVLCLSLGTFLLSRVRFKGVIVLHILFSGLFFALHYVTMKSLFLETNFDDGFFWSRVSLVIFAFLLLLVPTYFTRITKQTKGASKKTGAIVIVAKVLAGIAAFMLLKATDLGDVAVVQALDGLKFVFIILISLLLGKYLPQTAGENDFGFKTVIRKSLYIAIITIGFVILFI